MLGWIDHQIQRNTGYREELYERDRRLYWFFFGRPQFTPKLALRYLKLDGVDPRMADQKSNLLGHKIYLDSRKPMGEQELDHGLAVKTYRAWLALGS